jgi:hypothetical protein
MLHGTRLFIALARIFGLVFIAMVVSSQVNVHMGLAAAFSVWIIMPRE